MFLSLLHIFHFNEALQSSFKPKELICAGQKWSDDIIGINM